MVDLELETINSNEDWLELREGERARVIGRLDGKIRAGVDLILISLADWSPLVIKLTDQNGAPSEIASDVKVEIAVTRNEDGLEAAFDDINIRT